MGLYCPCRTGKTMTTIAEQVALEAAWLRSGDRVSEWMRFRLCETANLLEQVAELADKITVHNAECDSACDNRTGPLLNVCQAMARIRKQCPDCPKNWKIE